MAKHKAKTSLLLIHGGPGMDDSYFFPALGNLRQAFSLRSYTQRRKASLVELIDELQAELRRFENQPFLVLAHSWGCMLTLEALQEEQPKNLKGLIFVSCASDPSYNTDFEAMKSHWKLTQMDEPVHTEDEAFRKSCLEAVELFFSSAKRDQGLKILRRISYCKKSIDLFFDEYASTFNLKPVIRSLSIPVLNVYGSLDYRVPASHSAKISSLNPLVENFCMDGCGHFPFVEEPEIFCKRLFEFVEAKVS